MHLLIQQQSTKYIKTTTTKQAHKATNENYKTYRLVWLPM